LPICSYAPGNPRGMCCCAEAGCRSDSGDCWPKLERRSHPRERVCVVGSGYRPTPPSLRRVAFFCFRRGQRGVGSAAGVRAHLTADKHASCLARASSAPDGEESRPRRKNKKRILSYLGNCLPAVVTAKLPSRTRSPPPRHAVTAPPHATARHRILPIGKAKTLAFLPPTAILIFLHALCSAQKPMTTRTRTCRGRASELAPDHRT